MSDLAGLQTRITTLAETLGVMDTKVDDIRAKLDAIPAGSVVTQEQLDAVSASLDELNTAATARLTEIDDLA